jgi:hypothetical protein
LQLSDAEAIQQLFHWEVVRYLNALVPWPYPQDGALRYLRDICLPAIAAGVSGTGRSACSNARSN